MSSSGDSRFNDEQFSDSEEDDTQERISMGLSQATPVRFFDKGHTKEHHYRERHEDRAEADGKEENGLLAIKVRRNNS